MTETRHYLVLCPDNYYDLRLLLVPLGATDIDAFPCKNVEHDPHKVVRISETQWNNRYNIGAPNLGSRVVTPSGDNGFSVDTTDLFDPGNYPPPQDDARPSGVLSTYNPPPPEPTETDRTVVGAVNPDATPEQDPRDAPS